MKNIFFLITLFFSFDLLAQETLRCDRSNYKEFIFNEEKTMQLVESTGRGCILMWAELDETSLRGATFFKSSLVNAKILNTTDLREADLRWANLYNVNLNGFDMREANLIWTNMSKTELKRTKLRGAKYNVLIGEFGLNYGTTFPKGVHPLVHGMAKVDVPMPEDWIAIW